MTKSSKTPEIRTSTVCITKHTDSADQCALNHDDEIFPNVSFLYLKTTDYPIPNIRHLVPSSPHPFRKEYISRIIWFRGSPAVADWAVKPRGITLRWSRQLKPRGHSPCPRQRLWPAWRMRDQQRRKGRRRRRDLSLCPSVAAYKVLPIRVLGFPVVVEVDPSL